MTGRTVRAGVWRSLASPAGEPNRPSSAARQGPGHRWLALRTSDRSSGAQSRRLAARCGTTRVAVEAAGPGEVDTSSSVRVCGRAAPCHRRAASIGPECDSTRSFRRNPVAAASSRRAVGWQLRGDLPNRSLSPYAEGDRCHAAWPKLRVRRKADAGARRAAPASQRGYAAFCSSFRARLSAFIFKSWPLPNHTRSKRAVSPVSRLLR